MRRRWVLERRDTRRGRAFKGGDWGGFKAGPFVNVRVKRVGWDHSGQKVGVPSQGARNEKRSTLKENLWETGGGEVKRRERGRGFSGPQKNRVREHQKSVESKDNNRRC